MFHEDPNVDIAVIATNVKELLRQGIEFAHIPEADIADSSRCAELGISAGEELFVLGFPMGISGSARKYVIARSGLIARLDEEIVKEQRAFLIDASIFPGNSGGPVFVKPTAVSLVGEKAIKKAFLIGVVKGYLPYEEIAYDLNYDPPRPRIVFTENSGLGIVIPMEYPMEVVRKLRDVSAKTVPTPEVKFVTDDDSPAGPPTVTPVPPSAPTT